MTHPVLQTERLQLRPFSEDDFAALLHLHSDPEVNRFLAPGPVALSAEEVRARLVRYMDNNRTSRISGWNLETLDGVSVGRAGFSKLSDPEGFELGYVLKRQAWGKGYASEIAVALVDWFFAQTGEPRLFAIVEQAHTASIKVLERAGLRFWQDRDVDGVACQVYRITRTQFEARTSVQDHSGRGVESCR